MRIRKRPPRKNLVVQPEELLSTYHRIALWIEKHVKTVLTGVAALLIVVAVVAVYGILKSKQNREAAELEWDANRHYSQSASTPGMQGGLEYGKALTLYQKIVEKYPGTRSAVIAEYYIGNTFRQLGQWDKAIGAYHSFIGKHPKHPMVPSVYMTMGYTYLQKGDYTQAISAFQSAMTAKGSSLGAQAMFETARAYESSNRQDEALAQYEKVQKSFPGSPWAQEAAAKLNQAKAKAEVK